MFGTALHQKPMTIVLVPFTLLWLDTIRKANHKWKYLIWTYDFRDYEKHKGPKSQRVEKQSCKQKADEEKDTWSGLNHLRPQSSPQWHCLSNKVTYPISSQTIMGTQYETNKPMGRFSSKQVTTGNNIVPGGASVVILPHDLVIKNYLLNIYVYTTKYVLLLSLIIEIYFFRGW